MWEVRIGGKGTVGAGWRGGLCSVGNKAPGSSQKNVVLKNCVSLFSTILF